MITMLPARNGYYVRIDKADILRDVVVQWLECRTLNRKNPSSNPLAAFLKLWLFRCHNSLGCISEYYTQRRICKQLVFFFFTSGNCSVAECFPEKSRGH